MANTQSMCTSFMGELMTATHNFGTAPIRAATTADTFKAALYLASATVNAATTAYSSTGEVTGTNYTAGGVAVTNATAPIATNASSTAGVAYWTPSASITYTNVTLTTAFDETFQLIHEPHTDLDLNTIVEGLRSLRRTYKGKLFLEVVLLAGFNDSEKELERLRRRIVQISPDKIQLNTVVRPPSDPRAISLDTKRLEEIKNLFGEKAEIIPQTSLKRTGGEEDAVNTTILEMAKRRPVRARDVANVCDISLEEAESLVKGLVVKGTLRQQEHEGEIYYIE